MFFFGTLPYFLRDNQGKWQSLVGATAQTQAKTPLTEEQKIYRKNLQNEAKKKFQGKKVNTIIGEVEITGTGIREFLNQPHKRYFEKNELVKDLPKLIKDAAYLGYSEYHKDNDSKILYSYVFELKKEILDDGWLIMRENNAGEISFYSISDNAKVTENLKKGIPNPLGQQELQSR